MDKLYFIAGLRISPTPDVFAPDVEVETPEVEAVEEVTPKTVGAIKSAIEASLTKADDKMHNVAVHHPWYS